MAIGRRGVATRNGRGLPATVDGLRVADGGLVLCTETLGDT